MKKFTLIVSAILLCSNIITAQQSSKLTGTPISALGVNYNTSQPDPNAAQYAFDGNFNTSYASFLRSFGWVGLELNQAYVITKVGYAPRSQWASRMLVGVFEGANQADFSDAIPFYIVPETPQENKLTYANVSCSRGFKYVRFVHSNKAGEWANNGDTVRCNVSELEFYGYPSQGNDDHLYQLTNLPTVSLKIQNNEDIRTKKPFRQGIFTIIWTDEATGKTKIYTDSMEIRGRGNASWNFAKKPYRFKLNKKTKLLDMPCKDKRWTLINNVGDKTLFRNLLAYDIASCFNMHYVPSGRNVDVIFNGEYRGNYQLTDQLEQGKNRVDVEEMLPTDISGEELTGGYMIEIDDYADGYSDEQKKELKPLENKTWFRSNKSTKVTIHYPEEENIVTEQSNYIKNYFNQLEDMVFSNTYLTDKPSYRNILDMDSFLEHFITGELSGNTDTYWSVYLYKYRSNPLLYTGPVWDFDLAFENDQRTYPINNKTDYIYKSGSCTGRTRDFVNKIIADTIFTSRMKYLWSKARHNCLSDSQIIAMVDNYEDLNTSSQELNFKRWTYFNQRVHLNPKTYANYSAEVDNVRNYFVNRAAWLDNKIGLIDVTEVDATPDGGNLMEIFASNGYVYVLNACPATISIYSIDGRVIMPATTVSNAEWSRPLPKGLYLVRANNTTVKVMVP